MNVQEAAIFIHYRGSNQVIRRHKACSAPSQLPQTWRMHVSWVFLDSWKDLIQLSADDIDQLFAELAKSSSVLHRRELVERITAAICRFVMADEEILCRRLVESLKNWRGEGVMATSSIFYL